MSWWVGVLILAVAGMFAILVRRLPAAVAEIKEGTGDSPTIAKPKVAKQPGKPFFQSLIDALSRPNLKATQQVDTHVAFEELSSPTIVEAEPPVEVTVVDTAKKTVDRPTHITEGAAEAAYRERNFEEAALVYESLIRQQPQNEKFYSRLGLIYLELERFHDARDIFRTALKFGDQTAAPHFNLAMAEYGLGHRLTAVRYLKRAVALSPSTKKYQDLLVTLESERG